VTGTTLSAMVHILGKGELHSLREEEEKDKRSDNNKR